MRILLIAPQPFFTIRGTPLAIKELVSVFLKLGHSVDILTFHLGEDVALPGLTIYRNKLLSRLVRSVPPGFSFGKLILDLVLFPKALFLILKNKYDIVHCIEESAYFISLFRCLKLFLFVYDMDSDIPEQLMYSGKVKNWFIIRLIKEIEKFSLKSADAVVTICPVFTDKIKKHFPEKQIFQIEDVSVSDRMPPFTLTHERKRILYTGNFQKYQGVELLLEAFEKVSGGRTDLSLVLVGGWEGEINNLKKKYDNNNKIIFAGKKPVSEMPALMEAADILVSPRTEGENTPFKIYSYLASGRPILATSIISHTQILTDEKDALLVEATVDGISGGLERLLKDNSLAERISSGAKKLFEENYTKDCYERKVKSYLDFMEDLWERKR